jgi:hypothetical protein
MQKIVETLNFINILQRAGKIQENSTVFVYNFN